MSVSGSSIGPTKEKEVEARRRDVTDVPGDTAAHILRMSALGAEGQGLKTSQDGKIVLIPQPSSDPNDPLNWSSLKKHTILICITVIAFLPDFGSAMGSVTQIPQAQQWHKDPNVIQHNLVGNLFMLGAGAIFTVIGSAYFGRLPVLLYFTIISLGTSAWCAAATSWTSFLTARILNGFFSDVGQANGLMLIQDMFFFHEHPRKINIWSGPLIASPFFGPLITAFIINKKPWPDAFWVNTALSGVCVLLVVCLMDETLYSRNTPRDEQPIPRSRILRLIGVEQWRSRHLRETFLQALLRPAIAISKIPVILCVLYYFLNFAWIIGVNVSISIWLTNIYKFTPYNLGFFYFSPVIGATLGAAVGHWIHDAVGTYYIRRHEGHIEPEARLLIIWLASPIMAISILVLGFALQNVWHYMVLAVFFAGQVMGIMIATVALNSYLLDAYPEGSGEVDAWIVVGRTLGGFMSTYVEINWVSKAGALDAFAVQCGIAAASGFIILLLGLYGQRIRKLQGPMVFATESGYEVTRPVL